MFWTGINKRHIVRLVPFHSRNVFGVGNAAYILRTYF